MTFFVTFFFDVYRQIVHKSPTQLADFSVHSTRVIYHFGELGYHTMFLCE